MPQKKKIFTKNNSEKFLLLRGNPNAVNADGETLQNIFVKVSKSYKPGTSLLMGNIAALSNLQPDEDITKEGAFDDSDEVITKDLSSLMKQFNLSGEPEKIELFDDEDDYDYDEDEDEQDYLADNPNCPEILKVFNAKFENVLKDYGDDQIGPLDDDEDIPDFLFTSPKQLVHEQDELEKEIDIGDFDEDLKEKTLRYAKDSGDEKIVEIVTEKPLEFDCESILSTYSNKYNHPTVIKEEKIQKIKISNHLMKKTSNSRNDSDSNENSSIITTCNIRYKGETPEQRKERQRKFKEAKRIRREMKKNSKEAFKEEKKLQKSQAVKIQHNSAVKLL